MSIFRKQNFSKKRLIPLSLISLTGVIYFYHWLALQNPLQKYDICFKENYLGASGRLTEIVPVKCSNPTVAFDSPDVAVDYGQLSFADVDGDGISEYIVQPSSFDCFLDNCFTVCKIVVRVQPGNPPVFKIIERKPLRNLESSPYMTDSCSR